MGNIRVETRGINIALKGYKKKLIKGIKYINNIEMKKKNDPAVILVQKIISSFIFI